MSQTQKVRGAKNIQAGGHIIQNITSNILGTKITKDNAPAGTNSGDQK